MADHIDPVRLREQIAEFTTTLERLRGVSADAVAGVAQVVRERDALRAEVEKLRAFKSYVHSRLDDAGVPVDPPGPHRDAGCRIGQRLDLMLVHYSNVTQPRASPGASGGGGERCECGCPGGGAKIGPDGFCCSLCGHVECPGNTAPAPSGGERCRSVSGDVQCAREAGHTGWHAEEGTPLAPAASGGECPHRYIRGVIRYRDGVAQPIQFECSDCKNGVAYDGGGE